MNWNLRLNARHVDTRPQRWLNSEDTTGGPSPLQNWHVGGRLLCGFRLLSKQQNLREGNLRLWKWSSSGGIIGEPITSPKLKRWRQTTTWKSSRTWERGSQEERIEEGIAKKAMEAERDKITFLMIKFSSIEVNSPYWKWDSLYFGLRA